MRESERISQAVFMERFGAIIIAICMAVVAASFGGIGYLLVGTSALEAAIIGLVLFVGMAIYNNLASHAKDKNDTSGQIADLSRGTADLARQVGELTRRLGTVEGAVVSASDRARVLTQPLANEIETLGTLVRQIAESVAAHENAIFKSMAAPKPQAAPASPPAHSTIHERAHAPAQGSTPIASRDPYQPNAGSPPTEPERAETGAFEGLARPEIFSIIRRAVDANRIDLCLQPIVTLPQRKVRSYEALARLRGENGESIAPSDFIPYAETAGLLPAIDNIMLFRCVQVMRRLNSKNRELALFCNLSGSSLIDSNFFTQMTDFLDANKALSAAIILEFSQESVRAMGPIEQESMAHLFRLGYRFSMDGVENLRFEPRELVDRGFKYVKIPAPLLLSRAGKVGSDIDPADFSDLLGRHGIDLIVDRIESEGSVLELLDYDVRFGQGNLFSPPRPVRAEVLASNSDRTSIMPELSAPARPLAPEPGASRALDPRSEPRPPRAGTPSSRASLARRA